MGSTTMNDDTSEDTFVSYAQNFEDVMLWRALRGISDGFYIDVGANDPTGDSVTNAFYARGWCGINIEPIDRHYQELQRLRPRDVNLKCAVGAVIGEIEIWDCDVLGWATGDTTVIEQYQKNGYKGTFHRVSLTTLTHICDQYVKGDIHFLKIDVEGLEQSVLEGMDFKRYRPWIVVVEAIAPVSKETTYSQWQSILLTQDYKFVYADGINRFYVAREKSQLAEHFTYPPNMLDNFVRLAQRNAEIRAQLAEEGARRAEDHAQKLIARVERAERKCQEAVRSAQQAEEQLAQLLRSKSWKITAPLRYCAMIINRVCR
jgi:FkbM family methyltransferase